MDEGTSQRQSRRLPRQLCQLRPQRRYAKVSMLSLRRWRFSNGRKATCQQGRIGEQQSGDGSAGQDGRYRCVACDGSTMSAELCLQMMRTRRKRRSARFCRRRCAESDSATFSATPTPSICARRSRPTPPTTRRPSSLSAERSVLWQQLTPFVLIDVDRWHLQQPTALGAAALADEQAKLVDGKQKGSDWIILVRSATEQ